MHVCAIPCRCRSEADAESEQLADLCRRSGNRKKVRAAIFAVIRPVTSVVRKRKRVVGAPQGEHKIVPLAAVERLVSLCHYHPVSPSSWSNGLPLPKPTPPCLPICEPFCAFLRLAHPLSCSVQGRPHFRLLFPAPKRGGFAAAISGAIWHRASASCSLSSSRARAGWTARRRRQASSQGEQPLQQCRTRTIVTARNVLGRRAGPVHA